MSLVRAVLLPALAALVLGCGGPRHPAELARAPSGTPAPASSVMPAGPLAGAWQWRGELRREDGDLETATEDWVIEQQATHLTGHYDRTVAVTASGGRVFACNRGDTYTRRTRYFVSGQLAVDGSVTLDEDKVEVARSLCDDGARALAPLTGRVAIGPDAPAPTRLVLSRHGVTEELVRRPGIAAPARAWSEVMRPAGPGDLEGLWQRVLSRRDDSGQLRTEYEVWHLGASRQHLSGYYDHVVTVTAAEGRRFACSAGVEYTLRTRYHVSGFLDERSGTVYLEETSYETVPGPCENNRRRLERYEGRLASDELLLTWGGGAELLRRVPPASPAKN